MSSSYPEKKTESPNQDHTEVQRQRFIQLNLLRNTTKKDTQLLLQHTLKTGHQASTDAPVPDAI